MKIKEKGLTGKTAAIRRDSMVRPGGRGFNAFQEMAKGDKAKAKDASTKDKPKPEIWLEFMGTKIRVLEEDGGSVKAEDVPYLKGSTLKFVGCGGNVSFKELKVSVCLPPALFISALTPVPRIHYENTFLVCPSSSIRRAMIMVSSASKRHSRKTTSHISRSTSRPSMTGKCHGHCQKVSTCPVVSFCDDSDLDRSQRRWKSLSKLAERNLLRVRQLCGHKMAAIVGAEAGVVVVVDAAGVGEIEGAVVEGEAADAGAEVAIVEGAGAIVSPMLQLSRLLKLSRRARSGSELSNPLVQRILVCGGRLSPSSKV